jgi:glycosyltransferase involved in cell wall biosynthesis
LVVGVDHATERPDVAEHTAGLAEHLAGAAASVTFLTGQAVPLGGRGGGPGAGGPVVVRVRRPPAGPGRSLSRAGDELAFLTTTLATRLPRLPDLVIAVTPGLGGAVAAARIAGRHGAPLVLVVHDLVSAATLGSGCRGMRVATVTEARLLRRAAEVAVVSPDLDPVVRRAGVPPELVHLLPHWNSMGPVTPDPVAARRALGWPVRRFLVVHPIPGGSRQDLGTVLAAASLLPAQAELVLLGDAPRRVPVPAGAAGSARIRITGPLDAGRRRLALAAADLVLLAERPDPASHCLPDHLANAFGAGRAVLAAIPAANASAAELDRAGGAGLLIRPGDPQLLAAAVRALHLDGDLRSAMGRAGRRYAAQRLDPRLAMRRLDTIVQTALGGTP